MARDDNGDAGRRGAGEVLGADDDGRLDTGHQPCIAPPLDEDERTGTPGIGRGEESHLVARKFWRGERRPGQCGDFTGIEPTRRREENRIAHASLFFRASMPRPGSARPTARSGSRRRN
jgi:hypothetical protein